MEVTRAAYLMAFLNFTILTNLFPLVGTQLVTEFVGESDLKMALANFSRLRDYYNNSHGRILGTLFFYPRLIIMDTIAKSSNATFSLIRDNAWKADQGGYCHPKVQYYSMTWGIDNLDFWSVPCDIKEGETTNGWRYSPVYVQLNQDPWNFIFCDTIKKEKYSIWQFTIFTDPFDLWTWFVLLVSLSLVTLTSAAFSGKAFISIILAEFSSMFLFGTRPLSKGSKLFMLWTVMSLVIATFYTGAIQSTLIRPPNDDVLKTWDDLEARNYTLVMNEELRIFRNNLVSYLNTIPFSHVGEVIRRLMGRSQFVVGDNVYLHLAFNKGRWATIGPWFTTHLYVWIHHRVVSDYLNSTLKVEARKCHVGQELFSPGIEWYNFLPPGNLKLALAFQRIMEVGIYQRWEQEEHSLLHSERVQDRVRVQSPKKIHDMEITKIRAIGLEGRIITIFLLWSICIIISFFGFCLEKCLIIMHT